MRLPAGSRAGHAVFLLFLTGIAMEKKRCLWYNKHKNVTVLQRRITYAKKMADRCFDGVFHFRDDPDDALGGYHGQ